MKMGRGEVTISLDRYEELRDKEKEFDDMKERCELADNILNCTFLSKRYIEEYPEYDSPFFPKDLLVVDLFRLKLKEVYEEEPKNVISYNNFKDRFLNGREEFLR